MNYRLIYLLFCFLFFSPNVNGQKQLPGSSLIASVQVAGNKRTNSDFLLKHIYTSKGQELDSFLIEDDLRRIRTLPGILDASCTTEESDSGIVVKITVNERWTLLPVGDFGVTEDNYWVGAGAMESNAFGRGIYLYGYLQYKTPFAFHAIVRNPYLFNSKFGIEYQGKIHEIKESENSLNYDFYKLNEHQLFGKYEFSYEKDLLVGLAYSSEKIEQGEQLLDSRNSVRFLSILRIQKLDYRYFIIDGWETNTLLSLRLPFTEHQNTVMLFNESMFYKSFFNRFNLASRLALGISNEHGWYYMPYVIDNYKNIRGSGYRAFRGNQLAIVNLELRTTIYENSWAGIQFVGFSDLGYVAANFDQQEPINQDFLVFSGPGMRLIYKKAYNAVLSIDYGLDLENAGMGGWVIGWGQYF